MTLNCTVAQLGIVKGELLPSNGKQIWHTNPDGRRIKIPSSVKVDPNSKVTIEHGAQFGMSVRLFGDTYISALAEIGNKVTIIDGTVGSSRIGDSSKLENVTVGDNCQIGEYNKITGPDTVIEDGVVTGYNVIIWPQVTVELGKEVESGAEIFC